MVNFAKKDILILSNQNFRYIEFHYNGIGLHTNVYIWKKHSINNVYLFYTVTGPIKQVLCDPSFISIFECASTVIQII